MTDAERAAWLELRRQYVGASEAGALLGVSPWATRFALYHQKRGELPDQADSEAMKWGRRLEQAIGAGVAEDAGWTLAPGAHVVHPSVPGMAATPDFFIDDHPRGPGVLDAKNRRDEWHDDEPPLVYQVQLQHQMAVTGRAWGALAVLLGGNHLRIFEYERHEPTIAILEREVPAFWRSVRDNAEPAIDWELDADTIATLYRHSTPGKLLDIPRERWTEVAALCERYDGLGRIATEAAEKRKAVKAEILTVIGDAEKAGLGPWTISAKEQAPVEVAAHTRNGSRPVRVSWSEKRAKVLGIERGGFVYPQDCSCAGQKHTAPCVFAAPTALPPMEGDE